MSRPVRRALLSVSDKTGLIEFSSSLHRLGVSLISTGGTAEALRQENLPVTDVSQLTGWPEILGGRVKTLHPHIHAALLADLDDDQHRRTLAQISIEPIDLLVVNLYPFEDAVLASAAFDRCIESIDIGGPAMIRAAAKNHRNVAVVVEPADYDGVIEELRRTGMLGIETRRMLAAKAFGRTAAYDAAISNWFCSFDREKMPDYIAFGGRRAYPLRYGENPHQHAAFYSPAAKDGAAGWRQIQGKELSYNNINDMDAAWQCVCEFTGQPACVIVKHANPCGVAMAPTLSEAYLRAFACDSTSAYGGVIALNRPLNEETAEEISKIFTEVVVAPGATEAAERLLQRKPNLRLLFASSSSAPHAELIVKSAAGGLLVQSADRKTLSRDDLQVVTQRAPSPAELEDLIFAFTVAKHVKSNAIVYAKGLGTVGIGAGQMSRVDSTRIAALKANEAAKAQGQSESFARDSVVASDAFFPFPDGILAAAAAGATAVIQPGGSIRDDEVIAAADSAGLAMVFTGIRHFRH
ncbi:MAG TPA: bifunctional phosphoribosylaminoimidazolecarboxamide formyltransferase/IMP cyclohydrolase [Aestuariivirgaceae bacterium]